MVAPSWWGAALVGDLNHDPTLSLMWDAVVRDVAYALEELVMWKERQLVEEGEGGHSTREVPEPDECSITPDMGKTQLKVSVAPPPSPEQPISQGVRTSTRLKTATQTEKARAHDEVKQTKSKRL
ncbi:uncharacterized protein STEHIDRAFT_163400 [Stereum hirsutum FP-91666 SS1]|uniref:Uncharacterized protein n=1 Tax=Stereum hirsutum (strain FP-91666) TaxID=721885 RepID=R7RYF2_STEHR|nr:uncharacterized protein STEHIDRAFT_163400 [Stereum hirsutum FP-91666 SS1]EIM79843.1 hypothetical protein STEHIDRAFT_163400 [Stereum hirsutum FP-91666 SS1]